MTDRIKQAIEEQWDRKPHSKIDWLGLETQIRNTLGLYRDKKVDAVEALDLVDEIVASFTRRGREIIVSKINER